MSYAYWNQNTGQIARFEAPSSRLEQEPNWHPIDPAVRDEDAPVPPLDGVLGVGTLPHIPPPPAPATELEGAFEVEPVDEGPEVEEPEAEAELVARPTRSASKADWVEYAVTQGIDQAEAEASTRDALAERFTEKEPS